MTDELKNNDLNNEDEEIVSSEENLEEENKEEVAFEGEDPLNINISNEDIKDLTLEECDILIVKIEVAIDKCEDEMDKIVDDFVNYSEESTEYTKLTEEHKRLKSLEKAIIKQKRSINKGSREGGLFGNIPVWAFILFIICAVFTIMPINPYFPIKLYIAISDKIGGAFLNSNSGIYFFYFAYIGLFLITEIIIFVILLIRGIKSKEKMATFKSYLLIFIVNVIIDIPGVVIFLRAALTRWYERTNIY